MIMKNIQKSIRFFGLSIVLVFSVVLLFYSCYSRPDSDEGIIKEDPNNPVIPYSEYVTIHSSNLYLKGKKWSPYGASLYPTGHESNYHQVNNRSYMEQRLSKALEVKFNNVLIVDYINGVTSNPFDESIWKNVDYLITKAEEKGLKVLLDLSTYRNYLEKHKKIMPYKMEDWKDFLSFVGNRYKNNPTIWVFSLAGEAEPPNGDNPLRPKAEELVAFYRDASNYLKSVAPHHLISCGGLMQLGWDSGVKWQEIFALPNIHLPMVHLYGEDMTKSFPIVVNWCKTNQKPIYIEEFGKEKKDDVGDIQIAAHYKYIFSLKNMYQAVGIGFWNFGTQTEPPTYDVNESMPQTWELIKQNAP